MIEEFLSITLLLQQHSSPPVANIPSEQTDLPNVVKGKNIGQSNRLKSSPQEHTRCIHAADDMMLDLEKISSFYLFAVVSSHPIPDAPNK